MVRLWIFDKINLKIQKFYTTNYQYDKECKEALLAYIGSKFKKIGALSLKNKNFMETKYVEDFLEWFSRKTSIMWLERNILRDDRNEKWQVRTIQSP